MKALWWKIRAYYYCRDWEYASVLYEDYNEYSPKYAVYEDSTYL